MKKLSLLIACFTLPVAAFAAESAPAAAASAAASTAGSHAAVQASKMRGSAMGACRQDAQDRNLTGEAFKTAVAECMKK